VCLKRSGFITEVHHVDGDGDDAGVVYCEMQSRENSGESRSHLAMLRAMYPGDCGYKYETGGIMHNLRTSTSHAKVPTYLMAYFMTICFSELSLSSVVYFVDCELSFVIVFVHA